MPNTISDVAHLSWTFYSSPLKTSLGQLEVQIWQGRFPARGILNPGLRFLVVTDMLSKKRQTGWPHSDQHKIPRDFPVLSTFYCVFAVSKYTHRDN